MLITLRVKIFEFSGYLTVKIIFPKFWIFTFLSYQFNTCRWGIKFQRIFSGSSVFIGKTRKTFGLKRKMLFSRDISSQKNLDPRPQKSMYKIRISRINLQDFIIFGILHFFTIFIETSYTRFWTWKKLYWFEIWYSGVGYYGTEDYGTVDLWLAKNDVTGQFKA